MRLLLCLALAFSVHFVCLSVSTPSPTIPFLSLDFNTAPVKVRVDPRLIKASILETKPLEEQPLKSEKTTSSEETEDSIEEQEADPIPTPEPKPVSRPKAPVKSVTKTPSSTPTPASPSPLPKPSTQKKSTRATKKSAPTKPRASSYSNLQTPKPRMITRAEYLSNPPPNYPRSARRRKLEGTVRILVTIDSAGVVKKTKISSSSGYSTLDEAALAAVERWRFTPAQKDGQNTTSNIIVPVAFTLR